MLYYSRPHGLEWLHDEASDGSSRDHRPVTKSPVASIEPGTVLAARTDDGGLVPLDPTATDGAQIATGVAIGAFSALGPNETDRRLYPIHMAVLTTHADVIGSRLIWPAGITPDQKAAAVAQLGALGVVVV